MCASCRSRKMLQNEYFVAKIGVDTAENGPSKDGTAERCLLGQLGSPAAGGGLVQPAPGVSALAKPLAKFHAMLEHHHQF